MTNVSAQAMDVRPPLKSNTFIVGPTSTSAVISWPPETIDKYCTIMAEGADAVIVTDATPTGLSADESLVVSTVTAAAVNLIKTSIASSASRVVYSGADLNGSVGANAFTAGAIVSVTASNHANITGGDVWITGTQWGSGRTVRARIAVPNGGNGTFYGVQLFAAEPHMQRVGGAPHFTAITSIDIPAQAGTSGAWEIGLHTRIAAAAGGVQVCPDGVAVPMRPSADAPFLAYASLATPKLIIAVTSP
jgi:hypothetical protein